MKVQRLRLCFARGEEAKEMSHREVMRALEEAMVAEGLPLAYSEGRRQGAQISIAAPPPLGATSACELADIYLSERVEPERFAALLEGGLAPGLTACAAQEGGR